jgi:hypothetical protein
MNNKTISSLLMIVLFAALITEGIYYRHNEALDVPGAQIPVAEFQPIATLLNENEALHSGTQLHRRE